MAVFQRQIQPKQGLIYSILEIFLFTAFCCSNLCVCSAHGNDGSNVIPLPHDTVLACPGEQLLFMCTVTSTTSLMWEVTIPLVGENNAERRIVTYVTQMIQPITFLSYPPTGISFNISRLSANGTLPVVSTLAVANTMNGLNGTVVECSARQRNISSQPKMTDIHVVKTGPDVYPSWLSKLNSTEIFSVNTITVTLEWREEAGVTYIANIFSTTQASLIFVESTILQLNLSYNIVYNVSITGTLCGQNSINTTMDLSYIKCFDTFHEVLMYSADNDLFLEGTNVTFSCPPELILIGHNSSTCMRNGEWEPDPREVECKVNCGVPLEKSDVTLMFNSTLEGSQLIFWCNEASDETLMRASCLSNGRWSEDIDNYSCTTEVVGINNPLTMIIFPLVIVSGITLLLLAALIIVTAAIIKTRGVCTRKLEMDTGISSQDYHITRHQTRTLPPSEYSLIQYSMAEELPSDSKEADGLRKNNLVYADIGPGSFQIKNLVSTIDIQSHRVEYAQVNHGAQSKTPKLELRNERDPIGPDTLLNLDSLLIQLQSEVTPKWYEFGEAIGIEKKVLDKCKQYSPEQSVIEIFDNWLRNHAGQPTWKEVAEALRMIGLQNLAFAIEQVYDTGKLPIEVNMNEVPQGMLSDSAEDLPPPIPPKLLD